MDYTYENVPTAPDYFGGIKPDIDASAMSDKLIEGHVWYEEDLAADPVRSAYLMLRFTNDLSAGDEVILDSIIAAYQV